MKRKSDISEQNGSPTTLSAFYRVIRIAVGIGAGVGSALLIIIAGAAIYDLKLRIAVEQMPTNELVIYLASWIALLIISVLATIHIREVLAESAVSKYRRRANLIALMIGLVITIVFFKQSFLNQIFAGATPGAIVKVLLFGGSAGSGWVVWYVRQLKRYGDFFNVLLQTVVVGFCWYARLTAPEEVQLSAVAFLLGSLFRIATDFLKKAEEQEKLRNA